MGMEEGEIRAEVKIISEWAEGKTQADVSAALRRKGDSPVAELAKAASGDQFWMYSRYFGIGLLKVMEIMGVESSMEAAYPLIEEWVGTSLGKHFYTACVSFSCIDNSMFLVSQWLTYVSLFVDWDHLIVRQWPYFKTKAKLDMMETLMKEIEIREKKRMADRLEDWVEAALRKAEREEKMKAEVASEDEKKQAA